MFIWTYVYRSHRGVVDKPLWGPKLDPRLFQSIRGDSKLWSHLHMTLAVGGALNTNSPTEPMSS